MPWGLLLRVAAIALSAIGYRRMRRGEGMPRVDGERVRRGAAAAREGASLALRTAAVAVAATFCAVAGTSALTPARPGPVWLALTFAAAACLGGAATVVEIVRLRAAVARRRRQQSLRVTSEALDEDR